ncbi:D-TA family PLP-dependent enzyme [Flavilitoribacter nigricans]|uniref:Threonine aldolase n=1 Tax=Flavilitoribacter nigricans (strain ATCC 23147 / DSM 23189 / NBRC 102662 / NCIMB 1420 / SS-2) TaxID=1122177 RepID=A0A2D0N6F9_FLAN2|nr:D-TA family PLP-dependent enzyme [Flavilitoribacter nigricans]PHN03970.1 threonine aldolase [Flavilitoribacter nigricans DSM 23189 = NBRC 102662]
MAEWYEINNADTLDTPCLVVYPDRIRENIRLMLERVADDPTRLQPHVKTYKMREVVDMQMTAGIRKFKFATIAEGEMLGQSGAERALLAYQPVGPKITRLLELVNRFLDTHYAALVDNTASASAISEVFAAAGKALTVYLDLDVGMHRTGIEPGAEAVDLFNHCLSLPGVDPVGLHVYDGQFRQQFEERKRASDEAFRAVEELRAKIEGTTGRQLDVVAGGSPTFPVHALRDNVTCSPGTCLLWDWGYARKLEEQPFLYAGLVLTRVISHPGNNRICVDLGHKSVAAENPFPRVHFFNLPDARQLGQSEEHLVLEVDNPANYPVGTLLYGLPLHICPTCALYESAHVVRDGLATEKWGVIARDRVISI